MTHERGIESHAPGTEPRIWIDLDNSPHVPFFAPIIDELAGRGYSLLITARDCFQVPELTQRFRIPCTIVGRHYGKHMLPKLAGLGIRAAQLMRIAGPVRPQLAVSHGSRAQILASACLRIPTLLIADYEFSTLSALVRPTCYLCPDVIPATSLRTNAMRVARYPGIKEDVYVPRLVPDDNIRRELGLADDTIVVTLRPPASEAHYHCQDSDALFAATIDFLARNPGVTLVVLPRTRRQGAELAAARPDLVRCGLLKIVTRAVDGLSLIWHSDLVISGGGTMNREAAALGVPVYSTFRGPTGAVDRYLVETGRLVLLERPEDIPAKVIVAPRPRRPRAPVTQNESLRAILDHIGAFVPAVPERESLPDHVAA
jgi:hypothetical protein